MDSIDFISKLLATSNGKDKVMRIVSYSSMLFASSKICPLGVKKSLVILSSELSSARTVLRLFDDIPMLNYSLSCLKNSNKSLEIYEQLSLWKVKVLEPGYRVFMLRSLQGQLRQPLFTLSEKQSCCTMFRWTLFKDSVRKDTFQMFSQTDKIVHSTYTL